MFCGAKEAGGIYLPAPRLRQAGSAVGRFPEPGDEELLAGPSRNFQLFDPLDFLAEVTQHIPDPGAHLARTTGGLSAPSLRWTTWAKGWGAPPQATFDQLQSWTASKDEGIRFFSGIATYR